MLENSLILIFSVAALCSALFARINTDKAFAAPLYVLSFVCVAFCVTYAFLLGVDIEQILTYILAFTALTATVFYNDGKEALPIESGAVK